MKNILWIAALLFSTIGLSQNQGAVAGNVMDVEMNNEPLMFAHVEIQDTQWQTNTNLNGNFEIVGVEPGDYMLAISYAGYETRRLPIKIEENNTVSVHESLSAKYLDVGTLLDVEAATEKKDSDAYTSDIPMLRSNATAFKE